MTALRHLCAGVWLWLLLPAAVAAAPSINAPACTELRGQLTRNAACTLDGESALWVRVRVDNDRPIGMPRLSVAFPGGREKPLPLSMEALAGPYRNLRINRVVPVPPNASRMVLGLDAGVSQGTPDAAGLHVAVEEIRAVPRLQATPVAGALVIGEQKVGYRLRRGDAGGAALKGSVQLLSGGDTVAAQAAFDLAAGDAPRDVVLKPPRPGHYTVRLSVRVDGQDIEYERRRVLAIAAPSAPQTRFGVDAALAWRSPDARVTDQILHALAAIGVGALRERLRWNDVEPRPDDFDLGFYRALFEKEKALGFDVTVTFHDAPRHAWGAASRCKSTSACPPNDMAAVERFGKLLGSKASDVIDNIEFWNEPNSAFFQAPPQLYAQALKFFRRGLNEGRGGMRLLSGGSVGAPGPFYLNVLASDAASHFDIWSQHYYDSPDRLDEFVQRELVRSGVEAALKSRKMWLTEAGHALRRDPLNGSLAPAEHEQAIGLVKYYVKGFAAGFERVYYFLAPYLEEKQSVVWGLFDAEGSPRPALASLAHLIGFFDGHRLLRVSRSGDMEVHELARDGSQTASRFIVWRERPQAGDALSVTGRVSDHMGNAVAESGPAGAITIKPGNAPLFIEGSLRGVATQAVRSIPGSLAQATVRQGTSPPPYLLDVGRLSSGTGLAYYSERRATYVAKGGDSLSIHASMHSRPGASRATASAQGVRCTASWGAQRMATRSPGQGVGDAAYRCDFNTEGVPLGQHTITVSAQSEGKPLDSTAISVRLLPFEAGAVQPMSRVAAAACQPFVIKSSKNLDILPGLNRANCDGADIQGRVHTPGDTWIFPYKKLNGLKAVRWITFKMDDVNGYVDLLKDVQVQFVAQNGKTVFVDADKMNQSIAGGDYVVDVNELKDKLAGLEVHEIRVGWGRYRAAAGARFGFALREFAMLDERGRRVELAH